MNTACDHQESERVDARSARRSLAGRLCLSAVVLLAAGGCRSEMYDQPRYENYEASEFFDNGSAARMLVTGTVPRPRSGEDLRETYTSGKLGDVLVDEIPIKVDRELLARGQSRFRIYCTPCHGELGDGKGMVVQRGFNPPPSYHTELVRSKPVGHYFDVITRGFGTMYSYAARIPVRDRWAVVAYIRALQLSQHVPANLLTAAERQELGGAH